MGSRLFIVAALLVFAIGLLSSCAQNPSAEGDASAARAEEQGTQQRSSTATQETTQKAPDHAATTVMMGTTGQDAAVIAGDYDPSRDKDVVLFKDEYVVTKDGNLIIGGDVQVRCKEVLAFSTQVPSGNREIRKQLEQDQREQAELCTKAGFPPDEPPQSP